MTDLELKMLLRARDEAAQFLRSIDWRSIEQARKASEALRSQFEQARKAFEPLRSQFEQARKASIIHSCSMAGALDTKFLRSLAEQVRANAELLRTQKAPTSVARPWAQVPSEIYLPRPPTHSFEVETYTEPPRRRIGYSPWS